MEERMDSQQVERDLRILEHIERDPNVTQATLATHLGVAVGSVNWYLKRLINKGCIKVKRLQRKRLRYLITPKGIAEKAHLTYAYMDFSLRVYRELRVEALRLLDEVQAAGYSKVCIDGDGDAAEICRLTCLEQGVKVASASQADLLPVLRVEGSGLALDWAGSDSPGMSE
jgi:DNA-binding MarR family transcriptional regulator